MRASHPTLIKNKAETASVLVLEASYCYEQEQGINPILELIGTQNLLLGNPWVPPRDHTGPWGLNRLIATQHVRGDAILFMEEPATKTREACAYLHVEATSPFHVASGYPKLKELLPNIPTILDAKNRRWREEPWIETLKSKTGNSRSPSDAAWDNRSFCVISRDPEMMGFLKNLFHAFTQKEPYEPIAMWLGGGGNPFGRAGIAVGLTDRIDAEYKALTETTEREWGEIYWKAEDTGIPNLIPSTKYYALSPGNPLNTVNRGGQTVKIKTEHPVMFFLNPTEQQTNNSGWFTVEELQLWMEGKGPIPTKENTKSN